MHKYLCFLRRALQSHEGKRNSHGQRGNFPSGRKSGVQDKKGQRLSQTKHSSRDSAFRRQQELQSPQPGKAVVCVTGEGSLQMNIQEMQTILQNRLPVKLFVINNQGYHSIRQTQQSYFKPPLVGVGEESGDLSFPDLSRIMPAYGFPYRAVHASEDLEAAISEALDAEGAFVCEVFVTKYQKTEPKTSAKKHSGWKYGVRAA